MGNLILAGTKAAAPATGGNYTFLIVIVVLFGLMYFVMIRPQRNRQRQMAQMQSNIAPGAKVRTTAGMYATVTAIEGDDVVLEVAPGIHVRYLRRAIMDVITEGTPAPDDQPQPMASDGEEPAASQDEQVTADAGGNDSADGRSAN